MISDAVIVQDREDLLRWLLQGSRRKLSTFCLRESACWVLRVTHGRVRHTTSC
jgi:hypothetical protein